MLDKLSKRILKYLCSFDDPSNTYYDFGGDLYRIADAVKSDAETVRAAVGHLRDLGYIRYHGPQEKPYSFLLDHKGLHYREFSRLKTQAVWKERAIGLVSGVLIAVLAGLILKLL